MTWTVIVPVVNYLFSVATLPGEMPRPLEGPSDWTIEEGGRVGVVPNYGEWPDGMEAPRTAVCQACDDPKYYKVFNRSGDVPPHQFCQTGLNWGGTFSRTDWDRFASKGLAALLRFYEIPDTDPPGTMDEVLSSSQGVH